MKKKNNLLIYPFAIMVMFLMFSNSCKKDDSSTPSNVVKDIDGNVYHTVTIGTQVWMVENLKVTHFQNGVPIPNVTDSNEWHNLTTAAYCNYKNINTNASIYGRLYNWYAASDWRKIAPTGWHVPTNAEWSILTTLLGGYSVAGGKLKEIGYTHWVDPNTGATNETGFTALPGGYRNWSDGTFYDIGNGGYWWLPDTGGGMGEARSMSYNYSSVYFAVDGVMMNGYSVRCIKDN